MENMIERPVYITYFKPSGKSYTSHVIHWRGKSVDEEHDQIYIHDIIDAVRGWRDSNETGKLPGLAGRGWDGPIYIQQARLRKGREKSNSPDDYYGDGVPHILMPDPDPNVLPMQPIKPDRNGELRFRGNRVVQDLVDNHCTIDLNGIQKRAAGHYPNDDLIQFYQLMGYSVDAFTGLACVDEDLARKADIMACRAAARVPRSPR